MQSSPNRVRTIYRGRWCQCCYYSASVLRVFGRDIEKVKQQRSKARYWLPGRNGGKPRKG